MKTRTRVTRHFLIVLLSGVVFTGTCPAEAIIGRDGSIGGFGKLAWGVSVEQAEKAYPDLYFGDYELVNRREAPEKIYYRKTSPGKIGGVDFETCEYRFKRDAFYKIRASLRSKIGPRTLVTQAEASWGRMAEYLVRKYGEPKERRTEYMTEYLVVVKEMRWDVGDVFIHLNYKGPKEENEDRLIIEIGKKPEGRS